MVDLFQTVTPEALQHAARVLAPARYGYLGFLNPLTGWPHISRVALGRDAHHTPLILISSLSAHFAALQADARCSLLVGEPGAGDPLAHARITLECLAVRCSEELRPALRDAFVQWQPKSKLYVDFADFTFWQLQPQSASFNAGFGKAFTLTANDVQQLLQQLPTEV